jgi:hypothetical protein
MFDGKFRAPVDAAVKPLGAALRKTRMTPDHLTVVGLLIAVAAAIAIGAGHITTGLILVILAALPDLLDGALAKASPASAAPSSTRRSTGSPMPSCSVASATTSPPTKTRASPYCPSRSRRWRS